MRPLALVAALVGAVGCSPRGRLRKKRGLALRARALRTLKLLEHRVKILDELLMLRDVLRARIVIAVAAARDSLREALDRQTRVLRHRPDVLALFVELAAELARVLARAECVHQTLERRHVGGHLEDETGHLLTLARDLVHSGGSRPAAGVRRRGGAPAAVRVSEAHGLVPSGPIRGISTSAAVRRGSGSRLEGLFSRSLEVSGRVPERKGRRASRRRSSTSVAAHPDLAAARG